MKNHYTRTMTMLFALIFLTSCAGSEKKTERAFTAMDTYMSVTAYGGSGEKVTENIEAEIARLDSLFDVTKSDSDIAMVNRGVSSTVDEITARAVSESLDWCGRLGGALDITVYPLVEEWGFVSKDYHVPSAERISELLRITDYSRVEVDANKITLPKDVKLDLGAAAKGFAADRAVDILDKSDCGSAIVNLGGTIAAYGSKPSGNNWNIGIADPENSAAYFGFLECKNKFVATSGSYERYFEDENGKRYSHILNPKTGLPVDGELLSVSVIGESGIMCDCLSTALFVKGLDGAAEFYRENGEFDFIALTKDNTLYLTEGIEDSFKLSKGYQYKIEVISKKY